MPLLRTSVPRGVNARRTSARGRFSTLSRIRSKRRTERREVLARVVDDMVGAERSDQLDVAGAAYAGDLGPEGLRDLDGIGADAARGAVDQHLLALLQAARIPEAVERGKCRRRDGGGFLERQVGRHREDGLLRRLGVFGGRTDAGPEDQVTGLEPGDSLTDGGDLAGHVEPRHAVARASETRRQTDQERRALDGEDVADVETRRPDPHEDLVVGDRRDRDIAKLEPIDGSVPVRDDRLHENSPSP